MNPWGDSIHSANQSIGAAVDSFGDLVTWFKRDIEEPQLLADSELLQVREMLSAMSEALERTASMFTGIADAQSNAVLTFLSGRKLTREQFYILLASESIEWTNKTLGLSDFEDFELMELLRYEGPSSRGYIYLGADINDVPKEAVEDWYLRFISATYRQAIIPPEEIQWDDLRSEQRSFLEKYLPEAAERFLREG